MFVKVSKSFVFLWYQPFSNKLMMNSIWIDNSYFREEIWVSLDEAYYFCGNEKGFKVKFAFVKRDMPMNESYHILSFRSLREFTDKLPFLWHLLNCKLPKRGRKLLAYVYILTRELYVFTRKDVHLCFGTCRRVVHEMFIVWILRSILIEKMISLVIFDPDHSIKW